MKTALKFLVTCVFIVIIQFHANGQFDPPPNDPDLPLDPGSWVLVAAGVGYGVKKWRDARHKSKSNENTEETGVFPNDNK